MYNFYNNMVPEKRDAWRNAYEIKMAALEHEKRRYQKLEDVSLERPQVIARSGHRSAWMTILKAPARLLTILLG